MREPDGAKPSNLGRQPDPRARKSHLRARLEVLLGRPGDRAQCSLVADIESAESLLIEHEMETLRRNRRVLMLEIHQGVLGEARCDEIVRLLEGAGFRVREHMGRNWAFGRDELPVPP